MPDTDAKHSGSCLCGAVRFNTSGALRGVIYCHCTQCRKQTGHVVAATAAADADLAIKGADRLRWFAASDDAKRGFCGTCGTLLFWKRNGADRTSIMAGSFDRPTDLTGLRHIFVAEKGDYYDIGDDLPQHDASA